MPYLALDTSTEYLSLAISCGGNITHSDWHIGQKHAELTLPYLYDLLKKNNITLKEIQGIAFGSGPGSFTGLRIACSLVQGLAFGKQIPVLGISTFESLAQACGETHIVICIDARMNQIYFSALKKDEKDWHEVVPASVCDPSAVLLPKGVSDHWVGVGSGFAVYGPVLMDRFGNQLTTVWPMRYPRAAEILALALPRFAAGLGRPAHEAIPMYLRNKVALTTQERQNR